MNKIRKSLIFFTLTLLLGIFNTFGIAPTPDEESSVKHLDANGAAALIKKNPKVVVLDIRRPSEYENGHIAHAKNIDYYAGDFAKKLSGLDKSKTYVVHCASGGRSTRSLSTFKKLGFKSIVHLDGGFKGWAKAGHKVEK